MSVPLDRVDAAVLDLSGRLAGGVRDALTARTRTETRSLVVDRGGWRERAIAVARPPRVTAAVGPTIPETVAATIAGCRPRRLVLIGPAASAREGVHVGSAVVAGSTIDLTRGERIDAGPEGVPAPAIGEGTIDAGADGVDATTAWAHAAASAAVEVSQAYSLIAVVVRGPRLSGSVTPPPWREPTVARSAGVWLGRLLSDRQAQRNDYGTAVRDAAAQAIERCVCELA